MISPLSAERRDAFPDVWARVDQQLAEDGHAVLKNLISPEECAVLRSMYPHDRHFRSRIVMARHGFGAGEYKYFCYPLPALLAQLRSRLYASLAPIANRWNRAMNVAIEYPSELETFLDRCHEAGQCRPTPLILKYVEGDYNCLHQDLYGEHVFPLQVAILLAQPGVDFDGGEFVMTENRSSQQLAHVVDLQQGDGVIFTVNTRPVQSKRAVIKSSMRHGVSKIRRGHRYTAGLIFHDAL
jgi:uncharacterized protein